MLREVRELKKDAQVGWRVPLLLKKVLAHLCQEEWRTENEVGVILLTESVSSRAKTAGLVYILFRFLHPLEISEDFALYLLKELPRLSLKDALAQARVEAAVKSLKEHFEGEKVKYEFKILLPRAELEVFKAGRCDGMSAELYWCLKDSGIDPRKISSGLYEFNFERGAGPFGEASFEETWREEVPSKLPTKYNDLLSTRDFLTGEDEEKKARELLMLVPKGRFVARALYSPRT